MKTYKVEYSIHEYYTRKVEGEGSTIILFNGKPTNEEAEDIVERKLEGCRGLDKFIRVNEIVEIPTEEALASDLSVAELVELITFTVKAKIL